MHVTYRAHILINDTDRERAGATVAPRGFARPAARAADDPRAVSISSAGNCDGETGGGEERCEDEGKAHC